MTNREQTCVVGRIVVGVEELLDMQGAAKHGMLGNGVQISLQSSLPLCYELPVHVSDQLLRRKREADAAHLDREKTRHILSCSVCFTCCRPFLCVSTMYLQRNMEAQLETLDRQILGRFPIVLLHVD